MMRRMEARISSIEGSWTFAAWLIPEFPTTRLVNNAIGPARFPGLTANRRQLPFIR
jgi:hypothetical protein